MTNKSPNINQRHFELTISYSTLDCLGENCVYLNVFLNLIYDSSCKQMN